MIPKNSSHFPYQACLIPNFPEDIQHQVRNFGNHVVRPLGMVLAVISFACNASFFILAVRTRSLQHPSLLMLSSLAITDVIFSQYSLYSYIEILTHEHVCPKSGPHDSALNVLCSLATLGNLAIISRDRYLAVRKPWWYRKHVTKARALRTICVAWFISVIIAFMVYLSKKFGGRYLPLAQFLCLSFYAICTLSIAIHYLSIYFRKTTPVLGRQARAILDWEKRLASTVGWILVVLMFTFLPALLFHMVLYAKGVKNLMPFRPFYVFFLQLNGALNPLLNFGRLKQMRIAVRNLFKCFRRVHVQLSLRNSNDNDNCSNSVNNTNGSNNIIDNDNNRDNNYCGINKNNNNVNNNSSNNDNKDNRINTTSETTMTTSTTTSLTTLNTDNSNNNNNANDKIRNNNNDDDHDIRDNNTDNSNNNNRNSKNNNPNNVSNNINNNTDDNIRKNNNDGGHGTKNNNDRQQQK